MSNKNRFSSFFWKGLFTVLPIYLTFYFFIWLIKSIENSFSYPLKEIIGDFYFPGLGLISALVVILLVGLLMQIYIAQYLSSLFNRTINKVPLIGDIYSSIQSLMNYFSSSSSLKGKKVVMVEFDKTSQLMGIITRDDFSDAPDGVGSDKMIAVYIPMSYQIGGFTVYVPKKSIKEVNMSQKEALKWTFIAGINNQN